MKSRDIFVGVAGVAVGTIVGLGAAEYLHTRGADESAKAALMGTGSCLKSNDLVCAMTLAQTAIVHAPGAYSPYEAAGDVYARMNNPEAARQMYAEALARLKSSGEGAMLVTSGVVSVENASALVEGKLHALPR